MKKLTGPGLIKVQRIEELPVQYVEVGDEVWSWVSDPDLDNVRSAWRKVVAVTIERPPDTSSASPMYGLEFADDQGNFRWWAKDVNVRVRHYVEVSG